MDRGGDSDAVGNVVWLVLLAFTTDKNSAGFRIADQRNTETKKLPPPPQKKGGGGVNQSLGVFESPLVLKATFWGIEVFWDQQNKNKTKKRSDTVLESVARPWQ